VIQIIAIVVGLALGFWLSRTLRKPTSTAGAASVARAAVGSVGGRRNLSVPSLQRAVLSEMYRYVGRGPGGRNAVPDDFLVHLHPADEARVQEAPGFFRRGLIDALTEEGRKRGWTVPGHVRIETVPDPSRAQGVPAVSLGGQAPQPMPQAEPPFPPAAFPVPPAPPLAAPPPPPPFAVLPSFPDPDLTQVAGGGDDATVAAGATGFAAAPAPPPPPPPPATLERSDRPGVAEPLVADRLMIGRSSTADIRVDDSRVSRSHLCLERSGQRWTATDQGSSNGSWVNGAQMSSGMPRLLRDGDELTIGPVTFTFRADDTGGSGHSVAHPDAATRVLGDENRQLP
jgi:hypothetical protein